jgi:hypothetical protein
MIARLKQLVDRGAELRAEIDAREKELAQVEECIVAWARDGDQVPLVDEAREGKQFLAAGSKVIVPVVFTADKLIASFQAAGKTHEMIDAAAGRHLRKFYMPETTWSMVPKNGKVFRKLAEELLGAAGPALVTACLARDKHGIPKSDIKVEWKRASVANPEAQTATGASEGLIA